MIGIFRAIIICWLCAVAFGSASAESTNQLTWYPSATNLVLRAGGKQLNVRLSEPVVIAVAAQPEKWGFFQFPQLARLENGSIAAKWNLSQDSIVAYGKNSSGRAISTDGGKSWTPSSAPEEHTGLLLPNGDRLRVVTPPAIPTLKLKLPEPVGHTVDNYGRVKQSLYRHSELPPEVQGVCLSRLPKGQQTWTAERAVLNDPQALRYSLRDLVPIVWWGDIRVAPDKSIIAGIYPGYLLKPDGTAHPKGNVFFYSSTDFGRSWKVQGRILYEPDLKADAKGADRMGFTEPAYEILSDGSFVCVMRTTDGLGDGPMYVARSADQGRTWSRPQPISPSGVLPKLLRLDNNVLVLSSGRPGVQLRFSIHPAGSAWTSALELLLYPSDPGAVSCGYTDLLRTGPGSFLVIYSDFKFLTTDKQIRKAIKVREVQVEPAAAR